MKIDSISQNIIKISLFLENLEPNSVSEIWLENDLIIELKNQIPKDISSLLKTTKKQIQDLEENRRRQYLAEILHSLEYQIINIKKPINFSDFSKNCFGFEILRVDQEEVKHIEHQIQKIEKRNKKNRYEIMSEFSIDKSKILKYYTEQVFAVKNRLSGKLVEFEDAGFEIEIVTGKPWSAFNSHISPYKSKISLNSDTSLSKLDLRHLAHHEGYAGHHTELSLKDKFLVNDGFGEHGLIITFSPQTFISEAIAEGFYALVEGLDHDSDSQLVHWYYNRLQFALQNLATFLYFENGKSKEEINELFSGYNVSEISKRNIINFSTDSQFGKYSPVYYSAFSFFNDLYRNTRDKKSLIEEIFSQPCTARILKREFKS